MNLEPLLSASPAVQFAGKVYMVLMAITAIAGALTFMPERLMWQVFFGQ